MDILAARKKAAERARSGKTTDAASTEPVAPAAQPSPAVSEEEQGLPEPPAFPPLPDTEYQPDDDLSASELSEGPKQEIEAASKPGDFQTQESVQDLPPRPQPEKPLSDGPAVTANTPEQAAPERDLEMLAFLLGSEEYVVPVEQVREILTPKEITPVPHTADYLLGVCSLRGTVMPVVDLNRRLGLAASVRDEKSRIVVASLGQDDRVGLYVDRVRGVVRFLPSAVRPAPETVAQGAGAEFLQGIARKDDRLYILLDVEKTVGA